MTTMKPKIIFVFGALIPSLFIINSIQNSDVERVTKSASLPNITAVGPSAIPDIEPQSAVIVAKEEYLGAGEKDIYSETNNQTTQDCGSDINARAAYAIDASSPDAFFERNSSNYWPIASITKLMSAIVIYEYGDINKIIRITPEAARGLNKNEFIKEGDIYNATDLIRAMLMISSNDASEAVARDFGREAFIDNMNKKALELEMKDTNFADPSGLSARNQSTPKDISRLMKYILEKYPQLLKITATPTAEISELSGKKKQKLFNINQFAGTKDFIGGKTGFTNDAGENLVSAFRINGKTIITVILGSNDRFGETKNLLKCI